MKQRIAICTTKFWKRKCPLGPWVPPLSSQPYTKKDALTKVRAAKRGKKVGGNGGKRSGESEEQRWIRSLLLPS
jgi:hypothetical protein